MNTKLLLYLCGQIYPNSSFLNYFILHEVTQLQTSRKTSRKPHAETTKDPRFNVSP